MAKPRLKLLVEMLAKERATPQKPASQGEELDSLRWSKKEADPTAEAVLKDYLAENGLETKPRDLPVIEPVSADPRIRDAAARNYTREREAASANYFKRLRNANENFRGRDGSYVAPEEPTGASERDYWRAVEDSDVLPMSVGKPMAQSEAQPEGLRANLLALARRGDKAVFSGERRKLPELLNRAADTPAGAAFGLETNEAMDAREARGVGPLEHVAEVVTDPMQLALMAFLRKVK